MLTSDDATNFMVARAVTDLFGAPRAVVRVNDAEFASLYEELGLGTVDLPALAAQAVRAALPPG